MTFIEAQNRLNKYQYIVGQKYKGATIDELLICPTNPENLQDFLQKYIQTLDSSISNSYFKDDVDILVVCDKQRIYRDGIFIYITLDKYLLENNSRT